MGRPLGSRQASCLAALRRHGFWHRNCGWIWSGNRETERILDSLVRRGLAWVDGVERRTWRPVPAKPTATICGHRGCWLPAGHRGEHQPVAES